MPEFNPNGDEAEAMAKTRDATKPAARGGRMDTPGSRDDLWGWVECGCWIALALTPILYWVNGPAVSRDQLIVRSSVLILSLLGALGLRLRAGSSRVRRKKASAIVEQES